MRFVARRSLALLCTLAAMALVSCVSERQLAVSKLAPDNAVFDLRKEGLKALWAQELGQLTQNRRLKDIYSAGSYTVIEAGGGEIHCLDDATGRWQATTLLRDELHVSPTAVGTKLVFIVKNDVVMYNVAADQAEQPRATNFPLTARPLLNGNSLYLAGADGQVVRLPLDGGRPQWLDSLRGPIFEQPVVAGNRLIATAPSGVLIWNVPAGAKMATWSPASPLARITSSAAVVGGRIYVGDSRGILYCLDGDTGKWTWQRMMGAPVKGRLTAAGADLLVVTSKPELVCLDAGGTRETRWQREGVIDVIAIGKATAYVRKADGAIAAISMEKGEELWCDALPADCKVVGDETGPTFYVANPRGSVVAFTELD